MGFFSSSQHKKLLVSAQIVLISRGSFPYKRILSVSDTEHSSVIVRIAFDLARQLKAELSVLTVIHPHAESNEVEKLKELPKQISINARRHNLEVQCLLKTGNPIQIIRKTAEDFQLLVVGCSHRTSNTSFVQTFLYIYYTTRRVLHCLFHGIQHPDNKLISKFHSVVFIKNIELFMSKSRL